MVECCQINLVQ